MPGVRFLRTAAAGLLAVIICLGVFCNQPAQAVERKDAEPALMKHVVVISVDGLNQEMYTTYAKQSLNDLALSGASTTRCLAVKSDTVEAGEASLLTGSLPEEHLYFCSKDRVAAESMMDIFVRDGRSVLVVDGSGGKLRGFARGEREYVKMGAIQSDTEIMKRASELFLRYRPYFTYIYLNDCRTPMIGSNKEAYARLRTVETEIDRFVTTLKERSLLSYTTLVITSSRSSSPSNMVPLIIRGPMIKQNYNLDGASIVDIAPSLCVMAGLDRARTSTGLVMWNAMLPERKRGSAEYAEQQVRDLQQERLQVWQKYYAMEVERDRYSHQIEEIKEERENIFNFAGERERTIARLRGTLDRVKGLIAGMSVLFLIGYLVEYRMLKKRFLLFK